MVNKMSMKSTNMRVLLEDVKVSFKFAVKNILSFILAMIGVAIVTVILILVVAAIIVPIFIAVLGFPGMIELFTQWAVTFETATGLAIVGMSILFITPFAAPFMASFGALFGMAREIVESEGTHASGVFTWYKNKFLSLLGGGVIQFLVAILPIAVVVAIVAPFSISFTTTDLYHGIAFLVVIIVYWTIAMGALSMIFPAIIDGNSVIDSLKISITYSKNYFDRVYSVWIAFIGIIVALLIPIIAAPMNLFMTGTNFIPGAAWGLYTAITMIMMIIVVFPAMVIGMSRIYLILSGEEILVQEETHPDISFVGGI